MGSIGETIVKKVFGRLFFWLSWLALYFYLRDTTRTRVIVEAEGHILLVKGWHDGARWSLPGGGVHRGEAELKSAVREVFEETGIKLLPSIMENLGTDSYDARGLRYKIIRFGCRLPKKPDVKKQRIELLELAWFPVSAIQNSMIEPATRRQLDAWKQIR